MFASSIRRGRGLKGGCVFLVIGGAFLVFMMVFVAKRGNQWNTTHAIASEIGIVLPVVRVNCFTYLTNLRGFYKGMPFELRLRNRAPETNQFPDPRKRYSLRLIVRPPARGTVHLSISQGPWNLPLTSFLMQPVHHPLLRGCWARGKPPHAVQALLTDWEKRGVDPTFKDFSPLSFRGLIRDGESWRLDFVCPLPEMDVLRRVMGVVDELIASPELF